MREYCGLTYDTPETVKRGDYVVTVCKRKGGSLYKVLKARTQKRRNPDAPQRWVLFCEVINRNCYDVQTPEGKVLHKLYWYSRDKKAVVNGWYRAVTN